MDFNWQIGYPSQRSPVCAQNVVATSQPLAAEAGLRMLLQGGNAVDAALATAIALTVVEPTSNGIGSDAFSIVWDGEQLHGLNASGRSPASWSPDLFSSQATMPVRGWGAVTVPGAVSAWVALSDRFGALPFETLFGPAIDYAREGFPVSPIIARAWNSAESAYAEFPEFAEAFLPGGKAPVPGQWYSNASQAATLEEISVTRGESFYRGALAQRILHHSQQTGGHFVAEDFAEHRADWVGTATVDYRGVTLHEIPPNGQGLAALLALGMLRHFDLRALDPDSAESVHLQVEVMKLALADAYRYVSDPESMDVSLASLLVDDYLEVRARQVDQSRAGDPQHGSPPTAGTVYLTAADASGRMVSYIQSNYFGFGSGIVVPGTGISLQNRGYGFVLEEGHPNRVGPRKRPFHTIIPAFVTRAGEPLVSFGVMGGPMQAQGHVQMMVRLFDYGQNPQACADAPRWQVAGGRRLLLERGFSSDVIQQLAAMGHQVEAGTAAHFGGCQMIARLSRGYCAASEPRTDGHAVGF